nr:palmitoyltransferase ZDHHC4-like [Lytechinus pictus]
MHENLLPEAIQRLVSRIINYLIHERNPCFQYFYIMVLLLALYFYTVDVLPLALTVGTPPSIIVISYFCFASCFVFFVICSKSDPGVITMATLHTFRDVYEMDYVLYQKGADCWTCKFEKPARSKHCGTCNHCVHRFDHHCTWLNNCIGGFNHRYFLALVTSLFFGTGLYLQHHVYPESVSRCPVCWSPARRTRWEALVRPPKLLCRWSNSQCLFGKMNEKKMGIRPAGYKTEWSQTN